MKYMGSKNRLAKHLLPIILKNRKPEQWYVEPFVGGANMIDKVAGNRIGADSNRYLIEAIKSIRDDIDSIPKNNAEFSEEMYSELRDSDEYTYKGYVGFTASYGAKWLGGWSRGKSGVGVERDYVRESHANAIKQNPLLQGINLICAGYGDLTIPNSSIIYCDPPYQNTTQYKDKFNHDEFWEWCREQVKSGHEVFISEYNAPDDFVCVFKKEQVSSLTKNTGSKKGVECLFVHNSQHELSN